MTLNIVLGANAMAPQARSTDRPHKSAASDGLRFDEALNNHHSKRRDDEPPTRNADGSFHADMSLEVPAAQIPLDRENSSDSKLDPENEFDAVLDQFLDTAPLPATLEAALPPPPKLAVDGATDEGDVLVEPATEELEPDADTSVADVRVGMATPPRATSMADDIDPSLHAVVVPSPSQVQQEPDKRRATARVVPEDRRSNVAPPVFQRQQPVEFQPLPREEVAQPRVLEKNQLDRDAPRNAGSGLPDAPKVNVLSFSASLPPVNPVALGPTVTGLVGAMEADVTWRSAALDSAQNGKNWPTNSPAGVNTLRIQLNPAELGMVTARLTAAGQQLSVEIQVETAEARQKLTSDSEAILKALRSIGYDVERVTITQASANASGNPQNSGNSRDQAYQNLQSQGDGSAQNRGNGNGHKGNSHEKTMHGSGETVASRVGSDIYI